ncbi:hypothetical protein Ate01nite_34090 [Actinoplanes teichomyceticus]|nr:hypothetical protein Ate01nite_34090 [Actinoplanes teichomyceticus]
MCRSTSGIPTTRAMPPPTGTGPQPARPAGDTEQTPQAVTERPILPAGTCSVPVTATVSSGFPQGAGPARGAAPPVSHRATRAGRPRRTLLTAARSEALFASDLSAAEHHSRAQIDAAIRHAVRAYGGTRGCAGEVAQAYGDHPETAVQRMCWACAVVEQTYQKHMISLGAGCRSGSTRPDPPPDGAEAITHPRSTSCRG